MNKQYHGVKRIYTVLLSFYPRSYISEYKETMLGLFDEAWEDKQVSTMRFLWNLSIDSLKGSIGQYSLLLHQYATTYGNPLSIGNNFYIALALVLPAIIIFCIDHGVELFIGYGSGQYTNMVMNWPIYKLSFLTVVLFIFPSIAVILVIYALIKGIFRMYKTKIYMQMLCAIIVSALTLCMSVGVVCYAISPIPVSELNLQNGNGAVFVNTTMLQHVNPKDISSGTFSFNGNLVKTPNYPVSHIQLKYMTTFHTVVPSALHDVYLFVDNNLADILQAGNIPNFLHKIHVLIYTLARN